VSTTATVTFFGVTGLATTQTDTYRTSVTEAMLLGTWKFSWVNRVVQVTAPDGQVFARDYSAATYIWGQYGTLRITGSSGVFPAVNSIKVKR
jgi:hypothetical protein